MRETQALNAVVSDNLRKIREGLGLSLERLAEVTGVSRSMLNQIERGVSSPTLATIYKITSALKISLSELTAMPEQQAEVVDLAGVEPIVGGDGNFHAYLTQPFDGEKKFEIFYCEQAPCSQHASDPHQPGTEEHITLCGGKLSIEIEGHTYSLDKPGGLITFKGDKPHAYVNNGTEAAAFSLVIFYRKRM